MGRRKLVNDIDEKIMKEVMRQTLKVGTGLVSTKAVAKKLGISEPVIFSHFNTKSELMDQTFAYAWKSFEAKNFFELGEGIPLNQPVAFYLPYIRETLSHSRELVFAQHYLASSMCHRDLVLKAWAPTMERFKAIFRSFNPTMPEADCDFLSYLCVSYRINIGCLFVLKYFEDNDANLTNAFSVMDFGLVYTCGRYDPARFLSYKEQIEKARNSR